MPGFTYLRTALPSGVRALAAPMRERASVSIAIMVGAGSRQESPPESGIAHFVEHMVFKGTTEWPTAALISQAVEGVGGSLNAATDKEMTMFWAKVPAAEVDLAIDVLCDMVFRSRLDEAELVKERQVVIEELRMYLDSPQDHIGTLFEEVMWPGHPLGVDTAGTEATVSSFTRDDCLRFLGERYRDGRIVVTAAGALDPERFVERLTDRLGSWGTGPMEPWRPAEAVPEDSAPLRLVTKRTEQANVCIGARAGGYLDDRRHAMDLMTTVLGEGMSSRLFTSLREDRGLAYDVHAFTVKHRDSGALGIYLGCEPRRAAEAVRQAVAELNRLAEELVGDAELRRARRATTGRLLLQLEGTSSLSSYLGQQELLTGDIRAPEEVVAAVEAVEAEDVRQVARAVLDAGLRGAVIGPFSGPGKFLRALA